MLLLSAMTRGEPALADSFSSLMAEADSLAARGEGLRYDNLVGQFAAATFATPMKDCLRSASNPSSARFDVVAVLDATGRVQSLVVRPETNLAVCISPTIRSSTFPSPPHAPYPVHLDWSFKK